jgi:hypothetical protein
MPNLSLLTLLSIILFLISYYPHLTTTAVLLQSEKPILFVGGYPIDPKNNLANPLTIPGANSSHREYEGWEWFVKFRNPFGEYGALRWEPTFVSNELEFYALAILTFIHAKRHGARYMWLWWTTVAHGLMTELVSYWVEPIDNFWHAQSMFMFFGQREPLHIMCLYPGYIYTASVAVSRLHITERCEAAAMGLFVVIFDLPYDIIGIKNLWWTWHDTDANIRDRHYWVPWTSYYFHMTFACAFNLLYHVTRRYFVGLSGLYSRDDLQRMPYAQQKMADNWWGEFKALAITGMCSMPFGILQFVPGYHFCKDALGIHAEVTTIGLGSIYGLILFYGLMHNRPVNYLEHGEREIRRGHKKKGEGKWYYDEAFIAVCMHYFHYMILVLFAHPGQLQVLGMHQEQGFAPNPTKTRDQDRGCDFKRNLTYPYPFTDGAFWPFRVEVLQQIGLPVDKPPLNQYLPFPSVTVWKRPYICPYGNQLFDEKVVSFNCAMGKNQPWIGNGHSWYWICGTDWDSGDGSTSHFEYILVVWGICIFGLNVYAQAFCYPRTLYEQFFELCEFPKYYKTNNPDILVGKFEDKRINDITGKEEYLVQELRGTDGKELREVWRERDDIIQDAVGPVYAERGGLFGVFHDTYGKSTMERVRLMESYDHSHDRLKLFDTREERRPVGGITYVKGYAQPYAVDGDDENEQHYTQNGSGSMDSPVVVKKKNTVTMSSSKTTTRASSSSSGRSKTPVKRRG